MSDVTIARLVLAISVILLGTAAAGWCSRRLRQPAVVGELLAGLALGPSLLGHLPGNPSAVLFPAQVRTLLAVVAQLGVALYVFTVGYDLDLRELHRRPKVLGGVLAGSLGLPMVAGALLGAGLLGLRLAPVGPGPAGFVVLVAALLAITAVPVLARILEDRGIAQSRVGTLAMAGSATTDAAAWLLLAAALFLGGTGGGTDPRIATAILVAFLAVLLTLGRGGLRRVARSAVSGPAAGGGPALSGPALALFACVLMACAALTAAIGLHVVFGAFVCGLAAPRGADGRPLPALAGPIRQAGAVLLPVFFVTACLQVRIDLLDRTGLAVLAVLVLVGASAKLLGGYAGGRISGLVSRDAWRFGILMNTRGVAELVAVTVGYQAGLLDTRLYTCFVLMALISTTATGPALDLVERRRAPRRTPAAELAPSVR